jgi:hypothetical protein
MPVDFHKLLRMEPDSGATNMCEPGLAGHFYQSSRGGWILAARADDVAVISRSITVAARCVRGHLDRWHGNPKGDKGRRRHHHHRLLNGDIGNPHLEKQVAVVTAHMRISPHWLYEELQQELPTPPSGTRDLFDDIEAQEKKEAAN